MSQTKTQTKTIVGVGLMVATIGVLGFAAGLYYYGKKATCPKCPTCPVVKNNSASTNNSSGTSNNQSQAKKNVDLAITSTAVGGDETSAASLNGHTFGATVTVKNNGTSPSGPFTVGLYKGLQHSCRSASYSNVNTRCALFATTRVEGLQPGESKPIAVSGTPGDVSIHSWYSYVTVADTNNETGDKDTSNNIAVVSSDLQAR